MGVAVGMGVRVGVALGKDVADGAGLEVFVGAALGVFTRVGVETSVGVDPTVGEVPVQAESRVIIRTTRVKVFANAGYLAIMGPLYFSSMDLTMALFSLDGWGCRPPIEFRGGIWILTNPIA